MTITIKYIDNVEHTYNAFDDILQLDNYNDIIYIKCTGNRLSYLPELPNSLQVLWCNYNNLSSLPELPNSLINLCYYDNPIYNYIKYYFNGNNNNYFEHQKNIKKKSANKIGGWFLDCKFNPKYKYCRERLMKEYGELYG